jgi:hypothetical protein
MVREESQHIASHDNDVTLLIVSCDAYKDLWRPFFHSLFKYWPDCPYPIFLGSNESGYPDPRIKSILVGPDRDYSSNLLAMLERIETPWLILWIEDLLLSTPINTARLSNLIDLAQNHQAGYLKLSANTPWAFTKDKTQEIGPIPKGIKYRATIGLSLWKKDVLVRLLRPGESAWQVERNGGLRSNSFVEPFCCLSTNVRSNPPLSSVNSVIKGRWNRDALPFLRKEGLGDCIPNRPIQSFWSYLYAKMYLLRLDLYRSMGKYWYE